MRRARTLAAIVAMCVMPPSCVIPSSSRNSVSPPSPDAVIAAAGDIACPGSPCPAQRATGHLIAAMNPSAVLALGDNQYESGSLADFNGSYDPTWGRFKETTFPVPGNHEYQTAHAAGYFEYFGARAHGPRGYYSYDIGSWHLVALNSEERLAPQAAWLRKDLSADGRMCELAYWHRPRWSSGSDHGSDGSYADWWKALHAAGVDVVLSGHDHDYERFAPQTPAGRAAGDGIRQFVVGTGGRSVRPFDTPLPNSQKRLSVHGVLRMVLQGRSYAWSFLNASGEVLDEGTTGCHT